MIESLKKLIFTLETDAARVSAQRSDRLVLADRMIASLNTAIHERDREINQLTQPLAESRTQQASTHGVTTVYHRQLMEATVALWTGSDHALRVARRTFEEQRQIIASQRNILRHHHISCPLDSNLATSTVAGVEDLGLKPQELDVSS